MIRGATYSRLSALAALLLAATSPVLAAGLTTIDAQGIDAGHYVWRDEAMRGAPIRIVVSIADQRAYVYQGDKIVAISAVSTGKEGHETPTGTFRILEKAVTHHSNRYENASMPYMQRLTWDGVALHAGHDPGFPNSHGCIRLPLAFAKKLYGATRLGGTVTVTDEPVGDAPPALDERPMPSVFPALHHTDPPAMPPAAAPDPAPAPAPVMPAPTGATPAQGTPARIIG